MSTAGRVGAVVHQSKHGLLPAVVAVSPRARRSDSQWFFGSSQRIERLGGGIASSHAASSRTLDRDCIIELSGIG